MRKLLFVALAAGCDNPVDTEPNVFDAAREAGLTDAVSSDAGPVGDADAASDDPCGCLAVGQAYRFDSLVLTSLDGGPHRAIPPLNTRWAKDIAAHELDVYFIVTEVDGLALSMRAVNGTAIVGGGGAECELPETSAQFHLARQGCTLTMTDTTGIHIYAGNTEVPKNCAPTLAVPDTIPVHDVRLQFDLAPGCEALTNGQVLEGAIPKTALQSVCTCLGNDASLCTGPTSTPGCDACPGTYSNLEALVKGVNGGAEPNYGCPTSEGETAMCLSATFSAKRVPETPAPCP